MADWSTTAMGLNAGISAGLTQGYSSGGSQSANASNASGYSNTDAEAARNWSAEQATIAFNRQKELQEREMAFNAQQARLAREWQESMANTVYTRSVANMKAAGINPILATNMGLSGASVGSGQSASIGGSSAPMAQGYMDTSSAWSSSSEGQSSGWNKSEQGIVTALKALGEGAASILGALNSGNTLNIYMNKLEDAVETLNSKSDNNGDGKMDITDSIKRKDQSWGNWLLQQLNPLATPLFNDLTQRTKNAKKYAPEK